MRTGKCAVMLAAQKPVAHRFRSSTPIARRANRNERRPRRRGRIKPVDQIDHVPRHALIAALIGELLPHARDRSQHRLRPWIARLVCHRRALNSRLPKPCGSIFLHSSPPRIPGRIAIAFGTCVQPLRSCEPQFLSRAWRFRHIRGANVRYAFGSSRNFQIVGIARGAGPQELTDADSQQPN